MPVYGSESGGVGAVKGLEIPISELSEKAPAGTFTYITPSS